MKVTCISTSRLSKIPSGRLRKRGSVVSISLNKEVLERNVYREAAQTRALNESFPIILLDFHTFTSYFPRPSVHFSRASDRCNTHPAAFFSSLAHGFSSVYCISQGSFLYFRTLFIDILARRWEEYFAWRTNACFLNLFFLKGISRLREKRGTTF
jgi:tRNA(His) 5'-end guanylyltransferase